jgi:hypothetical protein
MDYHNDFVVPVLSGEMDEYLDNIVEVIKIRKDQLKPSIWEFQVGDRVRMVNTNPKYLNGAMATVKKVNRTKIVIDLDTPQGRFSRNINTPLSMVEKV